MKSLNKVTIIGNCGQDPEVIVLENGTKLAKFSVATSDSYKDKSGEKVETTEWHNVVAWAKIAEIVESYLNKGNRVYIEGKLQTRSWDDKEGNKRYTTEIVMRDMIILTPKQKEQAPPPEQPPAETHIPDNTEDDDLPF